MTEPLSKDARALLDAARGGDEPGAADRARVHERVMAAVGAGAAAAGAGAKAGLGVTKTVLGIVLVGALATVAYFALRPSAEAPRAPTPAQENAPPPPAPVVTPPAPAEREPEPEIEITEPAKRPVHKPAPAAEEDTLAAETALLRQASAALRAGDAEGALAAVAEHQKKYPRGHLVEEVAATRVRALCAAGRTGEGRDARDRFLARWPKSVHAARVQAACE